MPRAPLTSALATARFWWLCFAAWFAVLWVMSSQSSDELPLPEVLYLDKAAHLVYFAAGGAFLGLALCLSTRQRPRARPRWLVYLLVVAITIALVGALDEWHQKHTPGRSACDPFDWLADFIGGLLGAIIARRTVSRRTNLPWAP